MATLLLFNQYKEKYSSVRDIQSSLPNELKAILRYKINAVDAACIIREFTHLEYFTTLYLCDQWAAETLLVEARVPIDIQATENFGLKVLFSCFPPQDFLCKVTSRA